MRKSVLVLLLALIAATAFAAEDQQQPVDAEQAGQNRELTEEEEKALFAKQIADGKQALHNLFEWARQNGATIEGVDVEYFEDKGWGMVAKEEKKAEQVVVDIPMSLAVSSNNDLLVKFAKVFEEKVPATLVPQVSLTLNLLRHRVLGNKSPLAPYVSILGFGVDPRLPFVYQGAAKEVMEDVAEVHEETKATVEVIQSVYKIIAEHFSPHYEEIFAGSDDVMAAIAEMKKSENATALLREMVSFSDVVRASSVIWTRSWTISDKNGKMAAALVPVVDMFNHKDYVGKLDNKYGEGAEENMVKSVRVVTTVDVKPGEQVHVSYGSSFDNSHLLCRFGFIREGSEHEMFRVYGDGFFGVGKYAPPAQLVGRARQCEEMRKAAEEAGIDPNLACSPFIARSPHQASGFLASGHPDESLLPRARLALLDALWKNAWDRQSKAFLEGEEGSPVYGENDIVRWPMKVVDNAAEGEKKEGETSEEAAEAGKSLIVPPLLLRDMGLADLIALRRKDHPYLEGLTAEQNETMFSAVEVLLRALQGEMIDDGFEQTVYGLLKTFINDEFNGMKNLTIPATLVPEGLPVLTSDIKYVTIVQKAQPEGSDEKKGEKTEVEIESIILQPRCRITQEGEKALLANVDSVLRDVLHLRFQKVRIGRAAEALLEEAIAELKNPKKDESVADTGANKADADRTEL